MVPEMSMTLAYGDSFFISEMHWTSILSFAKFFFWSLPNLSSPAQPTNDMETPWRAAAAA